MSKIWVSPSKTGTGLPIVFCWQRERGESRRRRLSDGKRATCHRRRRRRGLKQMLLCANALSAQPPPAALSEMGRRAIREEFAPRRSNDPELSLPFTFQLPANNIFIMLTFWDTLIKEKGIIREFFPISMIPALQSTWSERGQHQGSWR